MNGFTSLGQGRVGELRSVSCADPGDCTATGFYLNADNTEHLFAVASSGKVFWGEATAIDDAVLGSSPPTIVALSCLAAGECTAVGSYAPDGEDGYLSAFVMDESGGAWTAPQPVPGLNLLASGTVTGSAVSSLSCATAGDCTAGGWYEGGASSGAFVVSETRPCLGERAGDPGSPQSE